MLVQGNPKILITSFSKKFFFKIFSVHTKTQSRCFQIPPVRGAFSKSKLRFRNGLVWTIGLLTVDNLVLSTRLIMWTYPPFNRRSKVCAFKYLLSAKCGRCLNAESVLGSPCSVGLHICSRMHGFMQEKKSQGFRERRLTNFLSSQENKVLDFGFQGKFSFFWHPEFQGSHAWSLELRSDGQALRNNNIKLTGIVVSKYDPAGFGMAESSVFRKNVRRILVVSLALSQLS